jgi:hypothetical protein
MTAPHAVQKWHPQILILNTNANGTAQFKNAKNCLNINIYTYIEATGGQRSNLYLNVVHFSNTSIK